MVRFTGAAFLAGSLGLCAVVHAQESPEPVLKGPAVPDTVAKTLVNKDARGNFRRLEGRPEEAAIVVLGLEGKARERATKLCTDRANAIGMLLAEHVDLLKEATDALTAGNNAEAQAAYAKLYEQFEASPPRDPLAAPMLEILKPAQKVEFTRLLDDYWKAWIDWELRSSKDKSDEARARIEKRLVFQLFQDEVRLAYERVIRPYRERLEVMYTALEPTPEQRIAIRDVVLDLIREGKLKPTPDQRRAAINKVYDVLDEERRAKLFELILRQVVPNE